MQTRAGVREVAEASGQRIVRDYLPQQHREFFARLPFVVVGHLDARGRAWASVLCGTPGFIDTPTAQSLVVRASPLTGDPLARGLRNGDALGLLGIDLATRRRNRVRAFVSGSSTEQLELSVFQSFGNCAQYIHRRSLLAVPSASAAGADAASEAIAAFGPQERQTLANADTLFIASGAPLEAGTGHVVDASHRGGRPGFVRVDDEHTLTFPDFAGNNHFNTLGNILSASTAGLLVIDFEGGDVTMLTGTVDILWPPSDVAAFQGAARALRFRLLSGLRLRAAFPHRGRLLESAPEVARTGTWAEAENKQKANDMRDEWRRHRVVRVHAESDSVRSLYLEPVDGAGIADFEAGQFMPLRIQPPGVPRPLARTYTVSNSPGEATLRISVKRITSGGCQPDGVASRYLHEAIEVGSVLEAKAPRGSFVLDPAERRPAVLLAGGIGVTPMVSMLRHVVREGLHTGHFRRLLFIHAARSVADLALHEEVRQLAAHAQGAIVVMAFVEDASVERHVGDPTFRRGRVDVAALREALPLEHGDFYLCGPHGFMQSHYDALLALGVSNERIFAEAFGPARLVRRSVTVPVAREAPRPEAAEVADVQFGKQASALRWSPSDGTLLELAERHGLAPAHSCRNGSCGSCAMRIEAGSIVYLTAPASNVVTGEVLICCAVPAKTPGVVGTLTLSALPERPTLSE